VSDASNGTIVLQKKSVSVEEESSLPNIVCIATVTPFAEEEQRGASASFFGLRLCMCGSLEITLDTAVWPGEEPEQ
jgi:hypothetical protein